ncbi:MAG: SON protein [Desulfovibrio sp.]|nr:SON protein [Desulfovibrio sp.]
MRITRRTGRLAAIAAALLLCACAGQKAPEAVPRQPAPQPASSAPCEEAWIYAPGNYVLDIAEGAEVELDPSVQPFPLYCTPAAAREALEAEIAANRLPADGWRLYRVAGRFDEIARPGRDAAGRALLARKALLVDWAPEGVR